MNRQHDIDRTLDAWFVEGPSVMPDRLFDAVFDQVERTPQRRLARLNLRFTEMNPRLRLFTALAAAMLVIVAAIAVIGGGSKGLVKASPSPSPTGISVASDGPAPVALAGTWMGGPAGLTSLDPDAGTAIVFSDSNFWIRQPNQDNLQRVRSRAVDLGDGRVMLTSRPADPDCSDGAIGMYSYSLAPSGQELTLAAVSDDCAPRLAALPGTWQLADCPTADDVCLGPVDAGTYSSQFFDPFVGPGGDWTPRFDALRYTVPDGWVNVEDWPEFYKLAPGDVQPDSLLILLASDVVLVSEADPCSDVPDPEIGTTASEMAAALADGPGIEAVDPSGSGPPKPVTLVPVSIGGLDGFMLDVRMHRAWTATCPWSEGTAARPLFTDRKIEAGFNWGLAPGTFMRLYLLDLGDGRTLLVDVEATSSFEFFHFLGRATPIVESFVFTR